jgi:hypothetical protein
MRRWERFSPGRAKGAEPSEQISDALGAADPLSHKGDHLAISLARGLQECAGGKFHLDA